MRVCVWGGESAIASSSPLASSPFFSRVFARLTVHGGGFMMVIKRNARERGEKS